MAHLHHHTSAPLTPEPAVSKLLLALAPLLLLAGPLQAGENWLQFRGPDGRGETAATGLPLKWDDDTNVAWKTDLDGEGWSSPVIYRGRVYLTSAALVDEASKDRSLRVLQLDAS